MIDLNPNHLETVKRILAEHLPGCEVRAFGSHATWTAKDYSDLDLAVVGNGPIDSRALARLKAGLEESDLPMRVDVLDWHSTSESFREVIERDHVVVQEGVGKQATEVEWREVNLGEIALLNDATYSPLEGWGFINYLDTGNITENRIAEIQHLVTGIDEIPSRARRKVRHGDIVYSTVRPDQRHFGLIRNPPENLLTSTGFAVIRGMGEVACTDFIYWFLAQDHIVEYLHTIAEDSTSTYPSIRPSDLEHLALALPPLPEQRAIAHILGTLDDKIELNRRMNETLEEMARALFKSWFVDFDPVRAKIDGRWRRGESLPGLPAQHYDLFPDRLVDSELGEIPEGWAVKVLPEIMDYKEGPGIRHWQYTNSAEGTRFINIRCIQDGDILLNTSNRIGTEEANGKYARFHLKERDIVVSTSGTLGRSAIVRGSHLPLVLNTSVIRFRPIDGVTSFSFLHGYLNNSTFLDELEMSASGSVQKNFGPMHLRKMRILCPLYDCLQRYEETAGSLLQQVIAKRTENDALIAQRDALLPKLVSGELRVARHPNTTRGG